VRTKSCWASSKGSANYSAFSVDHLAVASFSQRGRAWPRWLSHCADQVCIWPRHRHELQPSHDIAFFAENATSVERALNLLDEGPIGSLGE